MPSDIPREYFASARSLSGRVVVPWVEPLEPYVLLRHLATPLPGITDGP